MSFKLFLFYFLQNIYFLNSEKTICEHQLIKLPENFPLFYQRIETKNDIVECIERCVDDWQMCKSVLFVKKEGKQLCQFYGLSLTKYILPSSIDHSKEKYILLELKDPPCKIFKENFDLLKSISRSRRELLTSIPSEIELNKERITKELNNQKDKIEGNEEENFVSERIKLADDSYIDVNKNEKVEIEKPIQPIIVSRGLWGQRCRGGYCRLQFQKNQQNIPPPCPALKSKDPCAPQPQWLEWTESSCSVSCGNGTQKLRRYCSSGKNRDCKGEKTKTKQCSMPSCNYQWKDWTEWTKCSVKCGGNGKRMRYRTCKSEDNKCIGPSADLRPCGEQLCPSWSNWGEWGHCSLMSSSCIGAGIQQRKRDCIINNNELIECDGLAF
ncbi:hypothetical protein ACQ4LE_006155, partial [Meloidogyne hapla]